MVKYIRNISCTILEKNGIYEVIQEYTDSSGYELVEISGGSTHNQAIWKSDTEPHVFKIGDYVDFSNYSTKYIIKDCNLDGTYQIVPEGAANLLTSSFKSLICDLTPILDRAPFNFSYAYSPSVQEENTNTTTLPKECEHKGVNLSLFGNSQMWCCKFCGLDMKNEHELR